MHISELLPSRFLCWRMEGDTKVPCRPDGRKCDAHDPQNWFDHATVSAAPYGVAWVLNGDGWFFLDLDKCLGDDGQWTNEAQAIWQSFRGCMGEVSQSGRGLHILGRCDPQQMSDLRNKWDGWLECYTTGRFVAFGPHGWQPIGGEWTDRDWTTQLRNFVPRREELGPLPEGVDPSYTGPEDDEELIRMMLRSSSTAGAFGDTVTIKDLWEGNAQALAKTWPAYQGDGFDHSSADAALMTHLAFWTGKDMPRMDRLFRRSALMRDKYEKREDYRRETVGKAARLSSKVYDRPRQPQAEHSVSNADVYLTEAEMKAYFSGCVYVRDIHKVLTPVGDLLRPEQFNASYGGHAFKMYPDGKRETRKAFEAFTESTVVHFPKVKATCFRPDHSFGEIIGNAVNTYYPPEVEMRQGDVTPFFDFLQRLLPDERDRAIIMSWCCGVAQNVGKKPMWAPVLQGTEGNGKSLVGEVLAYCIGQEYTHRARAKELTSTHNGWMENTILIMPDEIHMQGRRETLDDLKPFLTNVIIPIRHMRVVEQNKYCPTAWFLTTNHRDAVIKSNQDRRYAIFYTAQQTRADLERDFPNGYFPELWDWLRDEGGFAAMAHWLMNTRPDVRFDPFGQCTTAPVTSSNDDAMEATMGPVEAAIIEAVESDTVGFRGGWISTWHLANLLKAEGLRVSRPKQGQILRDLGYEKMGRSSTKIPAEGNTQPVLWATHEAHADYHTAQYLLNN